MSEEKKRALRGFAAMDPEKIRKLAARGGRAVPKEKRSFSNRALASAAGRRGGSNVPAAARSFSRNRKLAREAGAKGGSAPRKVALEPVPVTP